MSAAEDNERGNLALVRAQLVLHGRQEAKWLAASVLESKRPAFDS